MENTVPQGRVNPTTQDAPNPAKYFAEWKSDKNGFEYYDKTTKEKVLIPLPFTFLPLTRGIVIQGYNEPEKASYKSNEVKYDNWDNIKKRRFVVKRYDNVLKKQSVAFEGVYDDVIKKANSFNAGYTESIYIAVKGESGKLELANLQVMGAGMTHWFDFIKANDIWSGAVTVKSTTKEKKGKNEYLAPVFSCVKIKPETDIEAAVLQKQIFAYLEAYYSKNESFTPTEQSKSEEPLPTIHQQNTAKAPVAEAPKNDIVFNPNLDDNLDLPF